MGKLSGIKAMQRDQRGMAHGSKRFGDATFRNPRTKRYGKVTISHRAPVAKADLTVKNVNAGPVHIPAVAPEDEPRRIAKLIPVEDMAECPTYSRYGNSSKPCDCKHHYIASDKRRRGMFGADQMIAGR